MKTKAFKPALILCILLAVVFTCMAIAANIQSNGGNVEVTTGCFEIDKVIADETLKYSDDMTWFSNDNAPSGNIAYKLYVPKGVDKYHKAPAVLLLHGYQNDKETNAAYAIELSRRGYVVMSIDEYGHGSTDVSMIERGYVNHKVTVNYGMDTEGSSYLEIGGQTRYKVLMNFSNLSFFNDHYSKDDDGNSIKDSSMGGIYAYAYLASMDMVDDTNIGVTGHSMGTWATWTVAAAYSGAVNATGDDISPKAVILQCGELFTAPAISERNIKFNNVLLLTAKYDEFNYFRDYSPKTVDDSIINNEQSREFLTVKTPLSLSSSSIPTDQTFEWNKIYGNFADGTARERALIVTNHRLTTHDSDAIATALEWFNGALGGHPTELNPYDQVFMVKEVLVLIAALAAIGSMLPLMHLLLMIPCFSDLKQALPDRPYRIKKGGKLAKNIIITMLIAAITYPFLTQLGHGLFPLPDTSIFRMTIGNGFLIWYLILILIMLGTTIVPFIKSKKKDNPMDYIDLGMARENNAAKFDWIMLVKSLVVAAIMVGFMYGLLAICVAAFQLDFRFIWPFFRLFSGERFLQFLVYFPVFAVFFILNNSKIFAQTRQEGSGKNGIKNVLSCWWKNALMMVGGILLLCLLEYIPFFMGAGPGADLLFSPTFGGPFMSLMIVFVPQVLVFSVLCNHIVRKTNNVFLSGITVAMLACWIVTGGSAIL